MQKINNWVMKVSDACAVLLLSGITLAVTVNYTSRNLFHTGLYWSSEFSTYSMVWCILIVCCRLSWKNEHISITLLPDSLKGAAKKFNLLLIQAVCLVFTLVYAYSSLLLFLSASNQLSSTMRWLPMRAVYIVIPVCCCIMALGHIAGICTLLRGGENAAGREAS
jgi:TRAP-type C4-dicarboxylate transport system permease small subunit